MPDPMPFREANGTLVPPQQDTPGTRILEMPICWTSTPAGVPCVVSCWRFTKPELDRLNETGNLWVTIIGATLPPIAIEVNSPFIKP